MNVVLHRVTEAELIRRVDSARSSVTLYAPGVNDGVAESLCRAIARLLGHVKIVLDVSQKSVDMGFLAPTAVVRIWEAQLGFLNGKNDYSGEECIFYHLAGLRVGVLVIDGNEALVYAPIAENMEDVNLPVVQRCPSGVETTFSESFEEYRLLDVSVVDLAMVEHIGEMVLHPAKTLSEIKNGYEERISAIEAEKKEAEERCADAEKRVKEASEKAVEEYKARFKIRKVEFSITSQPAAIGRKRVKIPSMFLVGLGNEVEEKLLANYRLFPESEEIESIIKQKYPEDGIDKFAEKEKHIRDHYLIQVPKFGSYIRTGDLPDFEKEISELKTLGETIGTRIRAVLNDKITGALERLFSILSAQWVSSSNPWTREYFRKHKNDYRSEKDIFLAKMKYGKDGTDELVGKFAPTIKFFTTPIDESLADDASFREALRKVLIDNRNDTGSRRDTLEDLIGLSDNDSSKRHTEE